MERDEGDAANDVQVDVGAGPLSNAFARSAARSDVPRDLLVAIAMVEDGLWMPTRRTELDVDNDVPVAGPLQLRRGKLDTLARAAQLSGFEEIELREDADLALEAGAMVLAELGKKTGATKGDLASWSKAIEEMGGFGDDAHREKYVHEVYATLARGGTFEGRDGEKIVLGAHRELPPSLTIDVSFKVKTLAGAQYPGAEWFPTSCTNKCNTSRSGAPVQYVLVHDTEGGWNASVATLQNDRGKSVQYIVDVDGRVGQFVSEETLAWHCGNFHYNTRSIGIEHVGYSTKPYPEAEYAASAKLVEHLTTKYEIPRDRAHIIGHDQGPEREQDRRDQRAVRDVAEAVPEQHELRRRFASHRSRRLGMGGVHAALRRHREVQRRHRDLELLERQETRLPLRERRRRGQRVHRMHRHAERRRRSLHRETAVGDTGDTGDAGDAGDTGHAADDRRPRACAHGRGRRRHRARGVEGA